MKNVSLFAAVCAALLVTWSVGCGPTVPSDVDVSTSTSNTTAAGGNVTAGTDTPVGETP